MISLDEAIAAVDQFEVLTYFDRVKAPARLKIAEMLMAMVNWPESRVQRNGYGPIPYIHPVDRLKWLIGAMTNGQYNEWPGIAEVRGVFCSRYTPADGINAYATNPVYAPSEDPIIPEPPKYLPQPGDEPIGDEFKNLIAAAAEKKRMK